jgi:hypothetical protein
LLSLAKRDIADGKAGSSYKKLTRTLKEYTSINAHDAFCLLKVYGDLYSLAALLPPDVFEAEENGNSSQETQIEFIGKGEEVYRWAEASVSKIMGLTSEIESTLKASIACDIASNMLLRAQLQSLRDGKGLVDSQSEECKAAYERAAYQFRRVLEHDPLYSVAWCGLGCAVIHGSPMLSQHAFSRAVELDPSLPDAYANLSFLYTSRNRPRASTTVSESLTQVADTPMMWINLAYMLEKQASSNVAEASKQLLQSADAYRAALQIDKLPAALYGLGLTCQFDPHHSASIERSACFETYRAMVGERSDLSALLWQGVTQIDESLQQKGQGDGNGLEKFEEGKRMVEESLDCMRRLDHIPSSWDVSLLAKVVQNVEFPQVSASIKSALPDDVDTLSRKISREPHRADLWVRLAKCLVQNADESTADWQTTIHAALTAAQRAVQMLQSQKQTQTQTQAQPGTNYAPPTCSMTTVRDSDLADALALQSLLASVQQTGTKAPSTSPSTSILVESLLSTDAAMGESWQYALKIDPTNRLAREVLQANMQYQAQ